ncbi:MAG TPA: hypothetical protein VHW26_05915 [Solirubrobacteraceae bacterium]|nr:hypothetical protein [Solirubrobacteraceae bacterium]
MAAGLVVAGLVATTTGALAEINATQPIYPIPLEITAHGILWNNGPAVDLVTRDGATVQISPTGGVDAGRGDFAVVGTAQGGLAISRLGAAPRPLAVGPSVGPGGCRDWVADPSGKTSSMGASVTVSGVELILAGSPACRRITPSTPRPLFARPLAPGGRWRILRWLPSSTQPLLSARGGWVAVGIPRAGGRMLAQVIDAGTGRVRNSLDLPDAYLSVAESGAVVAAVGDITFDEYEPSIQLPYKMLYIAAGGRVARPLLGAVTVYGIPSVSDGRVAYQVGSPFETSSLAVTDLRTHSTRTIAGFSGTQRELLDFDLRGNEVAWTQADPQVPPPARPPGLPCTIGPYTPPPVVTLHSVDLSRPGAPIAAPGAAPATPAATTAPCNQQQAAGAAG